MRLKMHAILFILVSMGSLTAQFCMAQAEENKAAPRVMLEKYLADLQKSPTDQALRENIIKLVLTLNPKPAIPGEVDELLGKARYAIKNAKSEGDFAEVADAYQKALLMAPWVAENYFDLGIAQEKAQKPSEAIVSFRFYLMAAPDAQDAKTVREHIGELTYAVERITRAEREQNARSASTQLVEMQTLLARLKGVTIHDLAGEWWQSSSPLKQNIGFMDCSGGGYSHVHFEVQGDGLILGYVNDFDYEAANGKPPKGRRWFKVGEKFPNLGSLKLVGDKGVTGFIYFCCNRNAGGLSVEGTVSDDKKKISFSTVRSIDGATGQTFYVRRELCGRITP